MSNTENLAMELIDAMQSVGMKVNLLNSTLTGDVSQLDSTTRIDRLIRALKDHTEEMHMQNEQMQRYIQAMENHTLALAQNTAAMDKHTNAMLDHNCGMGRHVDALYSRR